MKRQQPELPLPQEAQPFPPATGTPTEITEQQQRLLQQFRDSHQASSTYLSQNALSDITLNKVYVLHKNILQGTKLTPNIRARIRCFVMDQCAKQWILRKTSALACTYIDLFFLRKGFCDVQEVQTMAISCLMLARKQQEGKLPTISFNVFSKDSLLQWEKKVAKKLQYQLLPPTHITYGEHVAQKWDFFISPEAPFTKRFGDCEVGVNFCLRSFYEQLDCLFLVTQTLKWDLQLAVVNLFYLHTYTLNVPQESLPQQLSEQEFIRYYYIQKDDFKIFFSKFLSFYSKQKSFKLIPQLGVYLRMFLPLKGSKKEFAILNTECRFRMIRVWDKLQTYTKESYDLAKSVMEKIKRN